jgi:hypothetical protein
LLQRFFQIARIHGTRLPQAITAHYFSQWLCVEDDLDLENTTPSFAQHGTLRLSFSHNICTSRNESHEHHSKPRPEFCNRLLWSEGTVLVDPAASKETVMHHALGKQKKDNCQDDKK